MKKTYMTPKMLITTIGNVLMETRSYDSAWINSDASEGDGSDALAKQITLDFEGDEEEDE